MRRTLSLWFPTFSTDLIARRLARASAGSADTAGRIILLTRQVSGREIVVRCCHNAAAAGIAPGMDLAHSRARLTPGTPLHVEPHHPERDAEALHNLACWALRFSPLCAPDPPDGLLLDTTGTDRLHRGETRLIRSAAGAIRRLGLRPRIAAAATFACAQAIARCGKFNLARVPPGRERDSLAGLPIAALGIEPEPMQALIEIGITTIGRLLTLPRSSLPSRFGESILLRLDQALGAAMERIEPVRPIPPPRSELIFDGPTDQWQSVEAAARKVLETLAAELAQRQRGIRRLDAQILRPHASAEHLEINLSRPSRSIKHLWSLLRSRLEHIDLGEGVEGVILTALRTARLRHEQVSNAALGGTGEKPPEAAWGKLVDALATRLGPERVLRIEPVESHLPERAFRVRSVMEESPRTLAPITAADRPTRLFPRPEPAEVMALTPDGPVMSLAWRGQRSQVTSCLGPERLGPEWWRWGLREPPPDRDYFAVQIDSGRWLWVCRQVGARRWFVHGEWS